MACLSTQPLKITVANLFEERKQHKSKYKITSACGMFSASYDYFIQLGNLLRTRFQFRQAL